jgi:hypothetical protein
VSEFKVGDKVWAKATIKHIDGESLRLTFDDDWTLWFLASDCRPVEPANSSEIPNSSSEPLAPSPCMDGVDVDQFIEGIMEARGRTSDPLQVGDAVVIVERSHKWRGVRGRIVSVSESNEYPLEFISDCRNRLGYFRLSSIRKIDQGDPINPSHYKQGGIECIEAMRVALGGGFLGYLRGNAIKYLWRYDRKNGVEDLKKARWYLDRLISEVSE